jgi:hypothetical protein
MSTRETRAAAGLQPETNRDPAQSRIPGDGPQADVLHTQGGLPMPRWFKSLGRPQEPSGPTVTLRSFQPADPTVTQDRVAPSADGWVMEAPKTGTVHLFEVGGLQVEQCTLTYRASLSTQKLDGRAYLEMWVRVPGRGEFFGRGTDQTVEGTTGWTSRETRFYLKKGQIADLVKLNLIVEGNGEQIAIKDVELLKTPL